MIDRVELVVLDQLKQMRKLHRDNAGRGEGDRQPSHEVIQIGHVRKHVVADQQICLKAAGNQGAGEFGGEERHLSRNSVLLRYLRDVGGGLDAQRRNSRGDEVLQQITVVARDLDNLFRGIQRKARDYVLHVGPGVVQPALRVRGEVCVVGKDRIRPLELADLDEEAV